MPEFDPVLALLDAVPFRVDPLSLETTLESGLAPALLGRASGVRHPVEAFWGAILAADEREAVLEMLRATARDGQPRAHEHRALVPGRATATFRTAIQRAASGEVVGILLDVTSSRASERQAEEVESWLVTLGESLPFDFWICDGVGRFVLQNPASRRRLGNLLGQSALAHSPAWRQSLERALRGERVREELVVIRDGDEQIYSRVVSPVRGGGGAEVTGALGVDIDVTELKHTEQRLRASLSELQKAQDELVRRERLAVLGEMAAAVAHEVRNPLGAMANVVGLLKKRAGLGRPQASEDAQLLGILSEELNRLDLLVVNLFDLVRPLKVTLRPERLPPVIDDALADALRTAASPDRIKVLRRVDDAPLEVAADRQLLGLALINVLRNSLQAMPDGGELAVDVTREERSGRPWAKIAIRDSGDGIHPEVQRRMFEPFFTTRSTGSGLGLPIVKRVLSEHHGELEVVSAPGEGTAFVLRLPCVRAASASADAGGAR